MSEAEPSSSASRVVLDVACPFCGLVCDDLAVEVTGSALRVVENGCPISLPAFARPAEPPQPRIRGHAVSLDEAVREAASILRASRLPLYAGLGTDLAGMRAVLRLAERTGGIVDHMASPALATSLLAMQASGWVTTTLAELRNRLDLLLVVGGGLAERFPRFLERCVTPPATLFGDHPQTRAVYLLGAADPPDLGLSRPAEVIDCEPQRLPESIAMLRALVEKRALPPAADPTMASRLGEVSERMRQARYGVVVWAAGALPGRHGALLAQGLAEIVLSLNRTTRFACLALGGHDNAVGANQACTWQTGFPLPVRFSADGPRSEPHLLTTERLVASAEVDAFLWLSSFGEVEPPECAAPTIVLARPGIALAREPAVFLPVGTPGLDHGGTVYRTDGVVALPLRRLREAGAPSAALVLEAITHRLEA